MNNNNNADYFFWLGVDGEITQLSEEDFNKEIGRVRETERRWREVDIEGIDVVSS